MELKLFICISVYSVCSAIDWTRRTHFKPIENTPIKTNIASGSRNRPTWAYDLSFLHGDLDSAESRVDQHRPNVFIFDRPTTAPPRDRPVIWPGHVLRNRTRPGNTERLSGSLTATEIPPPRCDDDFLCESVDSYPSALIQKALKKKYPEPEEFNEVFSDPNIPMLEENIALRFGGFSGAGEIEVIEETPVCGATEHIFYPRAAKNRDEKWMYVVNDDSYIQGVRVAKCINEGSKCSIDSGSPTGFETICRQRHIFKRLLALKEDSTETYTDTFKIPSCCVCHVVHKFNPLSRRRPATTPAPVDDFPRNNTTTVTELTENSRP